MVKIVVGGQMDKQSIARLVEQCAGDKVEVSIKSDIDGALAIKSNQADYYLGACATGAGGALGLALGLLGPTLCVSISMPGRVMTDAQIAEQVKGGKRAFGFVNNTAEAVVPVLVKAILENN